MTSDMYLLSWILWFLYHSNAPIYISCIMHWWDTVYGPS